MRVEPLITAGLTALALQLAGCGEPTVSFSKDVKPILEERCVECHGGAGEGVAASGFSVRDYDSVMKGTSLGAVVVAGSSLSSSLYLVVAQKTAPEIHMPPQHPEAWAEGRGTPLTDEQIEIFRAWIDQGDRNN